MRTRSLVATALMAGALLAAPAGAALAQPVPPVPPDGGVRLTTALTGAAEVPGPGDPAGSGSATITLNPGLEEVCFALTVSDIAPVTAAHIHVGAADVAGPVVVGLSPLPAAGPATVTSRGCVTATRTLILAILHNPEGYYVNVHTTAFPAGAVRGQL